MDGLGSRRSAPRDGRSRGRCGPRRLSLDSQGFGSTLIRCLISATLPLRKLIASHPLGKMASMQPLSAAAQDRKSRLAQLKSLKRKQPDTNQEEQEATGPTPKSPRYGEGAAGTDVTTTYLSGRNYDIETKGPKLGFETAPSEGWETLEKKAAQLAEETKQQAEEEEKAGKPLDLFKLQPKKPNWDLKRDLDRKLEILNVRTDNAIARMVRERIANQRKDAVASAVGANGDANGSSAADAEGEAVGMEGATLVEAANMREREEVEEARREREEEEALLEVWEE